MADTNVFESGKPGSLNERPANWITSEELIAAEQAKFDKAREQNTNPGPISNDAEQQT